MVDFCQFTKKWPRTTNRPPWWSAFSLHHIRLHRLRIVLVFGQRAHRRHKVIRCVLFFCLFVCCVCLPFYGFICVCVCGKCLLFQGVNCFWRCLLKGSLLLLIFLLRFMTKKKCVKGLNNNLLSSANLDPNYLCVYCLIRCNVVS